ncbi:MAG: DUF4181 domain-containing protein [Firmicutes bacterium]|nr:DUF4181 domain-containing protein [Bacillota bacterium]
MFWIFFIFVLLVAFDIVRTEKGKFFSYNHVNEKHKKIDWMIRNSFIVILLLVYFYIVTRDPTEKIWNFSIGFLVFIYLIISEAVRAFMEYKYSENKKSYILTIINLIFIAILAFLLFKSFGFFWYLSNWPIFNK